MLQWSSAADFTKVVNGTSLMACRTPVAAHPTSICKTFVLPKTFAKVQTGINSMGGGVCADGIQREKTPLMVSKRNQLW
jgi:hypothetical protein